MREFLAPHEEEEEEEVWQVLFGVDDCRVILLLEADWLL